MRKFVWIATVCVVAFFVACQLVSMVLCLLTIIDPRQYLIGVNSTTFFVIIALNCNQVAVYCKYTGQPYKSAQHYKVVKEVGIVCAIWTVAYVIKLIAIIEGANILSLKDQNTIDLAAACSMAFVDFLTLIVPYYCVVDLNFVNMLTGEHLLDGTLREDEADALLDTEFQPIDVSSENDG